MSDTTKSQEEAVIKKETVTTLIDKGVEFIGKIKATNGRTIMVNGVFEGQIETTGGVIVAEGGVVRGSVTASRLNLHGVIEKAPGDAGKSSVTVSDYLVMESSGRLTADTLSYGALQMSLGAVVRASMQPLEKAASVSESFRSTEDNGAKIAAAPATPSMHLRAEADAPASSIPLSFPETAKPAANSGAQAASSGAAGVRTQPADPVKVVPLNSSPLVANA